MYYIFIENDKINGAGQAPIVNEEIKNLEVSENTYNSYIENPLKYKYENENIIENPEYESIIRQQEIQLQKEKILEELNKLDIKRIRAVCEDEIKNPETNETWLDYYNSKILELRKQLTQLSD